jgi:glycosyltransferase involved in cell wall biosynthesis
MAGLKSLAVELGVSKAVRFLGEVRDITQILARARLYVLSSRSEGIPLTILEAMACGLPVVATRVGGVPEVVIPNETGLLVQAGYPAELAEALSVLWGNTDKGVMLGAAGRERVERDHDVCTMIRHYENLYGL